MFQLNTPAILRPQNKVLNYILQNLKGLASGLNDSYLMETCSIG